MWVNVTDCSNYVLQFVFFASYLNTPLYNFFKSANFVYRRTSPVFWLKFPCTFYGETAMCIILNSPTTS